MRNSTVVLVQVVAVVFAVSVAFAGPKATARFKHADKNRDGVIDSKEKKMEHKWEHRHWMKEKAKVSNAVEARYDKNGDGWLEPAEAKEMLRDRYQIIKTDGKAKVDTAIEKLYDTNADGVLDLKEAEEMFSDIK